MTDKRILVYGTDWCPDCQRAKEVFKRLNTDYDWKNTDSDQDARTFVMNINHGNCSVPTIIFPDGSILVEPSSMTLESKIRSLF
jgi:mycoredoxin